MTTAMNVLVRALANQFVMGTDYAKSLKLHRIIKEEHLRVLQQVDFLVTPTSPVVAPQRGDNAVVLGKGMGKVRGPGSGILSRNLRSINATGLLQSLFHVVLTGQDFPSACSWLAVRSKRDYCFVWATPTRRFLQVEAEGLP